MMSAGGLTPSIELECILSFVVTLDHHLLIELFLFIQYPAARKLAAVI